MREQIWLDGFWKPIDLCDIQFFSQQALHSGFVKTRHWELKWRPSFSFHRWKKRSNTQAQILGKSGVIVDVILCSWCSYWEFLLFCPESVSDEGWFDSACHEPFNVLMDRVKYHDLYLSTGCCSCAVNVTLKPLYPLFEDLQYSRPHASLSALKLHY